MDGARSVMEHPAASDFALIPEAQPIQDDPVPLQMLPPELEAPLYTHATSSATTAPAPHHTVDNIQAIAVEFVQMQPSAISGAELLVDDLDG